MDLSRLKKEVKNQLEHDYDYDFLSEFFTDDIKVMLEEVIETTHNILTNSI